MTGNAESEGPRPGSYWRGLIFNVAFYGWTVILLPVATASAIVSAPAARRIGRLWVRGMLGLLARIVGLRYRVIGREHLPEGPAMIAFKHQSAWETLALNALLDEPVFVLKQELTWIPVFGWILRRAGMVAVDRAGGGGALRRMVAAATEQIGDGRQLVIFPQGTRTPPGESRPYQPGVAALYRALDVPVVPATLNSGLFWPRRSLRLIPGTITVAFLPPIAPGMPRRDFMAQLERVIEDATIELIDGHRGPSAPTGEGTD